MPIQLHHEEVKPFNIGLRKQVQAIESEKLAKNHLGVFRDELNMRQKIQSDIQKDI